MKSASKLLFFGIFIFIVAASQTQGKPDTTLIRTDYVIQKYDSALNAINQVKQSIPAIVEKQKATLVKISYFNYWFNRWLKLDKSASDNQTDGETASTQKKSEPQKIIVGSPVYGGTPKREQTDRERNEGRAFKVVGDFFRNLFKRNE